MAHPHVYIDAAAVRAVANRFDTSAEIIDSAARSHLGHLGFDGASAGRAHIGGGDALRRALDQWGAELGRWSRASAEIASALRTGADGYADAERRAAVRVG